MKPNKGTCFIIMSFDKKYNKIHNIYKEALSHFNIKAIRADDFKGSRAIIDDIYKGIAESLLIIADISEDNPNVFFELGRAYTLNKNILLFSSSERAKKKKIPFDVSQQRITFYEIDSLNTSKFKDTFLDKVKNNIYDVILNRKAINIPIANIIYTKLLDLQKNIESIVLNDSYFELSVALWRLNTEEGKSRKISQTNSLAINAKDKYSYLRYVFGAIMKCLGKHDVYRTLSTVAFWGDGTNIGTDNFLTDNIQALQNSVSIKRLILVNSTRLKSNKTEDKIYRENLKRTLSTFEDFESRISLSSKIQKKQYYPVCFYLFTISTKKYADMFKHAPFAIITNEKFLESLSIFTEKIDQKDSDPSLRLYFHKSTDNELIRHIDDFDDLYDRHSISLLEMKKTLRV